MNNLIFVDCEANGPCPGKGSLTEFGAVHYTSRDTFHGQLDGSSVGSVTAKIIFSNFAGWLEDHVDGRPIFVSDNVAFDWQWINHGFWHSIGSNPFGHSGRRISDFYAGLVGNWRNTQAWKSLRITPHDHNPVHDALGNAEAFERILNGELGLKPKAVVPVDVAVLT